MTDSIIPSLLDTSVWIALAGIVVAVLLQFIFSLKRVSGNKAAHTCTESTSAQNVDSVKVVDRKKKAPPPEKDSANSPLLVNIMKGHGDAVCDLSFSADGRGLATACADGVVRVFKLEDVCSKNQKFLRINMPAGASPTAVSFGADSSQLAVVASHPKGDSLFMFGSAQGQEAEQARQQGKLPPPAVRWQQVPAHSGKEIRTLVSAASDHGTGDGSAVLVTCSEATDVCVWAADNGKCVGSIDSNQLKNTMAGLSPDGRFIAVAAFTADVKIWEVEYGKDGAVKQVKRVMLLKGHQSAVTWLCFSSDSKKIVTASKDGTIKLWNIEVRYHMDEDPKCLLTHPIPSLSSCPGLSPSNSSPSSALFLSRIALSPDSRTLAAAVALVEGGKKKQKADLEGSIAAVHLLWMDLQSGGVVATAPSAHEGPISYIMWSPVTHSIDGQSRNILATCSNRDKKVKLWQQPT